MNQKGSIIVRVVGTNNIPLKQQAFVRLFKMGSAVPLFAELTRVDSSASFNDLPGAGWYTVEASAAGYRTQRKDFNIIDAGLTFMRVEIGLEPESAEGVETFVSPSPLPGKAQKHVDKGVAEFRGGDLKRAQKEFAAAYEAAPKSPETNYLLGSLYLRTKDLPQAEKYFVAALATDPDNVFSLVGLGHVRYQSGDLKGATEILQKALTIDRKQWEALWLLSEIHLRTHDYEAARSEAQKAIELGRGSANGAEFVEGEALSELGRTGEAVTMLQAFLRDAPADPNAPAARELAGRLELEMGPKATTTEGRMSSSVAAEGSLFELASPEKPVFLTAPHVVPQVAPLQGLLPTWEPLGVDDEKPSLAGGVTCPTEEVIRQTGKRVAELVDSVNRIEAKENVTHEELSTLGRPVRTEKRKFDYLISIEESTMGLPMIDESWQATSADRFLGRISMFGLADLPLVFHPALRVDFSMTCEGLGKWQDQAAWIVYFRQRPDRPERIRSYGQTGGSSYSAGLKGRAWVSAGTYQILRMEANLMKPIPQIGLGSEEDVIEYGPVPFQKKNTVLWLPTSADIYFYFQHRPFHRHHAFTNYALFSVSASQKIGQPAEAEEKSDRN